MLPRKDRGNESLVDVAVIGSGPAGSTIGRLLAEWGYSVLTLNRPQRGKPCLAETLPPSSRKLFNFLGILSPMDEGGFYRTNGNTAWWGNTEKREEHYSGPQQSWGYQVLRKEFDQLLSDLAEKSGAQIYSNAVVRHVDLNSGDSARLEFNCQNGVRREIHSRFVLDCSGRAGVLARKEFRKMEPGFETLALSGVWKRNGGWEEVNKTHTLVETYPDGWAWSVPLSSEVRHFTVMIDSRAARKPRERGLQTIYHEALGKTKHVRKILAGAEMQQPPWSCDASLYTAHCFAGPQFLLVGDAASFIDPLSSYGVKKALASAWLGAVTVNTCLKHPELRTHALEFFSNREREIYSSYLRQSVRYFKEASVNHPDPFWIRRSELNEDDPCTGSTEENLKRDARLPGIFDGLKRSHSIRLRKGEAFRLEKRPEIQGREIVMQESVTGPGILSGLRYLGGINLPNLIRIAEEHRQVPALFEAYNRISRPASLPNFMEALSVLLARGVLKNMATAKQAG